MTEVTAVKLPDWLTEANEDMKKSGGEFEDIQPDMYVFEITGWSDMKTDSSGNLGCSIELTIQDEGEKFDGRKIWPWAILEGEWSKILTNKLIVAWIMRNPDKAAYLGERPANQQEWESYLNSCVAGKLTAIASIKPKKKTADEIAAGYKTKYDVYVSRDQFADQPKEG